MRLHSLLSVRIMLPALALALALPVVAWRPSREQLTLQPESRLWVDGTSSIKSFSCKASEVSAMIDAVPNGIARVALGEKGVREVSVTVPANKLDCGNGTMNDHMRKALKVTEHPSISFKLFSYDVSRNGDGVTGTLNGTLDLGGVDKPITIAAVAKNEGGALRVTGSYPLKMTDYDLEPPKLMFGRIKVGETVSVKFDLFLKG
jgi:polyisoprenoid-binding protein YceI